MSDRASRLFVERSPPSMDWLEKVFNLIKETESLGIVSGGLQEVRIKCEDKTEILDDSPVLFLCQLSQVYYDDGGAGTSIKLEDMKEKELDIPDSLMGEAELKGIKDDLRDRDDRVDRLQD